MCDANFSVQPTASVRVHRVEELTVLQREFELEDSKVQADCRSKLCEQSLEAPKTCWPSGAWIVEIEK